jgi:hypothetical protein
MIEVLRLLVFCWLTLVALWALRSLLSGNRHTVLVVLVGHWAFNGLPLLWDLMFGMPTYSFPNFARAALDPASNLIYLLFVAAIPVLLAVVGLPWRRRTVDTDLTIMNPLAKPASEPGASVLVLYGLMMLPLPLALLSPVPLLYLQYGFVADDSLRIPSDMVFFHSFVAMSAILSVTVATSLLTSPSHILKQWLVTFPWVIIAVFLMGKRTIIALYLVLLGQRLWDLDLLKGARIPIFLTGITLVFALTSAAYQYSIRRISTASVPTDQYYESLRIDYGRDHTIKTAIFAELQQEKIMSYRGQATLFDVTSFVPRSIWPQKPYPYGIYMTSYALGIPPQFSGWTFTTSIFDEAIANYGWLGFLSGPIFLGLLCRLADGNQTILFRSLGYIICVMFLVVQLNAFLILFAVWLGGSLWHQYRRFFSLRTSRLQLTES